MEPDRTHNEPHDHTKDELRPKEARQGTRPSAMVWVLLISTVVAAIAMYLILAVGWTGPIPWSD